MSPEPNGADVVRRTTCRVCEATGLELILQLGPTPLANAFLESPAQFADERWYPLDVFFCPRCSLFQLLDVVDPETLFRHYLYVTGTSTTMAGHNKAYARTLAELLRLGSGDTVVEVAANDGSLLRCFAAYRVRTIGVEPARNLATEASAFISATVQEFFTSKLARELRAAHGPAKLVAANNVLAFARVGKGDSPPMVCVLNLSPVPRHDYRVGMPVCCRWREVLNTDSAFYGGSGVGNLGGVEAEAVPWHEQPFSATLTLPPLGAVWLVPE